MLAVAATPTLGRALSRSKIAAALRRGGRQRRVEARTEEIQTALRAAQLAAPDVVCLRHGVIYDEETAWAHRVEQAA